MLVLAEATDLISVVKEFGYPVALTFVLLYAIYKGVVVVVGMIEKRNQEALTRETNIGTRLSQVEGEFRAYMETTAKESTAAMNRMADAADRMIDSDDQTRTVLLSTQQSLESNRKVLEEFKREFGSSDRLNAVRDARRG